MRQSDGRTDEALGKVSSQRAIAREKYPATMRIVLSGQTDAAATIRALPVAHQFLSKPIEQLREGMVIAADVHTKTGMLLVARGHEVTPGLVRRLENFERSIVQVTIAVLGDPRNQPVRRSAA